MMRCPHPINRILLMRKKNLCGPLFQNIGVCAKSVGAYRDANGPGSEMVIYKTEPVTYLGEVVTYKETK